MRRGLWFALSFFMLTAMKDITAKPQTAKPQANPPAGVEAPAVEAPLVFIAPVDYEPWVMLDASGKVTGGILYEMAHILGAFAELPVKVEAVPFPRFESLAAQQDYDFTFINEHQNLTGGIRFPKVAITTQLGLVYLKKNKAFADCKKIKTVAFTSQNSDALRALIQKHCGQVTIVNTYNLGQRMKMLNFGRVDSFLGSNGEMELASWFGAPCDSLAFMKFFDVNWHIFAKSSSRLTKEPYRSRVDKFISLYESEHYQKVRKKVLGDRYCPPSM